MLALGCFAQQPGATTFDTKFDLTEDPAGLLAGSFHLWNPSASFGELQNQMYGYFFPQGPFFLLLDLLAVPDWVAQRLWSALLLIAAYEGCRWLVRSLEMPAYAGVLAGLVYALSPRLLGASGVLTGEIPPAAALPWSLLPLVLAARGRMDARAAGLLSGVAVLCMGGINAVGTLAMVPAALVLVLANVRRPGGRRLAAWWGVGVVLATAWWMVPLLLLGRYSPPFLDFIETAAATTAVTSWGNSVRGADHWLAYAVAGGEAWWPGAQILVTTPVLIILGSLIAAAGVAGLTHRAMPLRGPFVVIFLIGILCLVAGNPAIGGSLVDGTVRSLLDGALAPFRNVHKVDPLARLPLALGFAHLCVLAVGRLRERLQDSGKDARSGVTGVLVVLVAALLVSGGPLFTGDMRTPGWREVPQAWNQTARFLEESPDSRAMILPGAGFGQQTWGWTIDEPIQGVSDAAWVTRSQVPLVPGPTARVLDALEQRLSSGQGSEHLSGMLRRMGITHLVLRRDLDVTALDAVGTEQIEATLRQSTGLERVASYGSTDVPGQALIDIYLVDGAHVGPELVPSTRLGHLDGAPEDVLVAMEAGLLDETPVLVGAGGEGLVSDGYRKVERQFGRIHQAVGQTMSADEEHRSGRASNDYPGVPGTRMVTAEYVGGVEISASSAQGYANVLGAVRPEEGPAAAFDGRRHTAWRSAWLTRPVGQRLDFKLREPVTNGVVLVRFDSSGEGSTTVTRVRATLGGRTSVLTVPSTGVLAVPVDEPVTEIGLEVAAVADGDPLFGRVAIAEVEIPGVTPGRTFVMPQVVAEGADMLMHSDTPVRACFPALQGLSCDLDSTRVPEDHGTLDRTFTTAAPGEWRLSGTVVARQGPGAAALLEPLGGETITAVASSVYGGDVALSGHFAFDGDPATYWLADPGQDRVEFELSWEGTHTIDRLFVDEAPGGARPRSATITSGAETRTVELSGLGVFEPLQAVDGATIVLERGRTAEGEGRPLGAAEIRLDGLDLPRHVPDPAGRAGADCGRGPAVRVDGVEHPTRVSGTVQELLDGRPLHWELCGDEPVTLGAGEHRVQVDPTAEFVPVTLGWSNLAGASAGTPDGAAGATRAMNVLEWADTRRTVRVGPGEEAVLRIPENDNPGWRATLDGRELEKVAVDGWQQGYVVPAGAGGTVELVYGPDRPYRWGLFLGLLLAIALVVGADMAYPRQRTPELAAGSPGPPERTGPGGPAPARLPTRLLGWLLGGILLLVGGPAAFAGWAVGRWAPRRELVRVGGAVLIGLAGVVSLWLGSPGSGNPGLLANLMAAAGVGILVGGALAADRRSLVPDRPRWRPAIRWEAVTGVAVFLIAVQTVVRGFVSSGSYFRHDDFAHLSLAKELGLSGDYLIRDHGGHLEVGQYLLIWVLGRDATTSFAVPATSLVVMQLIASLLLWWCLRLLFRPSWWLLVPFAAYLFTPLGLVAATWWAAGIQAYPLQICMLVTLIGWIKLCRGGSRAWAWGLTSLVAHALGLFFWEKAGLILPALLAVHVLVLAHGPVRQRLRAMVRVWPWLLGHGLVLVGYVVIYLAVVDLGGSTGGERTRGLASTLDQVVARTLLPGMFGLPWSTAGAENTLYPEASVAVAVLAGLMVLGLVALSIWRRGPGALAGWALIVGYVAADVAMLYVARGDFLYLVVRDPRYITDALPIIVIGVCAAFVRPVDHPRPETQRALPGMLDRRRTALACTGVLAVSTLLSTHLIAPEAQHDFSRSYVTTLVAQLEENPQVAVTALPVPPDVTVSIGLEGVLRAVGHELRLDQPGTELRVVDQAGNLQPVVLIEQEPVDEVPVGDCGWAVTSTPLQVADLGVPHGTRVASLTYFSAEEATVHLAVGLSVQVLAVPEGVGTMWFVLPPHGGELTLRTDEHDLTVCVTEVTVGAPWPGR